MRSEQKVAALHEVLQAKTEIGPVRPHEWSFGKISTHQHEEATYTANRLCIYIFTVRGDRPFKGVDLGGGTVAGCRDFRGKTEEFR